MDTSQFFRKIRTYTELSPEAELAWKALLQERKYKKGDNFVNLGQPPRKLAFVVEGLFGQFYTSENGDAIIKYFFPENRIAGSVAAMLTQTPSAFAITAIENSIVFEYDFSAFKTLFPRFPDIAEFYVAYLEKHWIIDKEPLEISLRHDTAKTRYQDMLRQYPDLLKRLKKHHIAAYLGITPTQLSRIFFADK